MDDHKIFRHREQALGLKPCSLTIKNCRMVNVFSGTIEEGVTIAVSGSRVVGIGDYEGEEVLDAKGRFVHPGLIDSHMHLESSMLTIPELARLLNRHGTTTIISDPHEIANVASIEGISYLLDTAANNGRLGVYFTVPSCVPALPDPEIETYASYMGPTKLSTFFGSPWFVTLGEMMNVPGTIFGDVTVERKLQSYLDHGIPIDGHAPMLRGKDLNAYIYMGVGSDHESTAPDEADEKLRRGMHVMIRQGSTEENLGDLLPIVTPANAQRCMFCTDDRDPIDLAREGHMNYILRKAVAQGLDPILALQMCTLHPARYVGRRDIGGIFPGGRADLVITPDLEEFRPDTVIRGGTVVLRDGEEVPVGQSTDRYLRSTMNCQLPSVEELRLRQPAEKVRVIGLIPGQIVTEQLRLEPTRRDGALVTDPERDLLKIVVFDRHRDSGSFGVGFVKGFGLKRGAIATSVSHDSHNLVAVGATDEEILAAASLVRAAKGGISAVMGSRSEILPLPIGGLMSEQPWEEVVRTKERLLAFCAEELGCTLKRPFMALSFLSLPVIPRLKLTDKGLIEVEPGKYPRKVELAV